MAEKIVGYLCEHSGVPAFAEIREDFKTLTVKEVPCSGRVEIPEILKEFELGADAVIIVGCHKGSCRSLTGSHYAEKRVARVKSIMKEIGLNENRLALEFLSNVEPARLSQILTAFSESVKKSLKEKQK
jgi:F420-non-reducing hydrogenase iron-sulfur subunit